MSLLQTSYWEQKGNDNPYNPMMLKLELLSNATTIDSVLNWSRRSEYLPALSAFIMTSNPSPPVSDGALMKRLAARNFATFEDSANLATLDNDVGVHILVD